LVEAFSRFEAQIRAHMFEKVKAKCAAIAEDCDVNAVGAHEAKEIIRTAIAALQQKDLG
jgi:hypothetical protein